MSRFLPPFEWLSTNGVGDCFFLPFLDFYFKKARKIANISDYRKGLNESPIISWFSYCVLFCSRSRIFHSYGVATIAAVKLSLILNQVASLLLSRSKNNSVVQEKCSASTHQEMLEFVWGKLQYVRYYFKTEGEGGGGGARRLHMYINQNFNFWTI